MKKDHGKVSGAIITPKNKNDEPEATRTYVWNAIFYDNHSVLRHLCNLNAEDLHRGYYWSRVYNKTESAQVLLDNNIKPWTEMTAWMPSGGEFDGFCSFGNSNAVKAGIKYRPLAVTARDTLEWWQTLPDERTREPKAGLSITKEIKVLKKWKSKTK